MTVSAKCGTPDDHSLIINDLDQIICKKCYAQWERQ